MQVPVDCEKDQEEGLIEKYEVSTGIVTNSLTTVKNGYALTSSLNTNDHEVVIAEPRLKLARIGVTPQIKERVGKGRKNIRKAVLGKLRLEQLNSKEKEMLDNACLYYHDIFYLPKEKLSSTNAARYSMALVLETAPIHTRPYRLPEAQKAEIEREVEKLLDEGIIEESISPWNSPLLVVPKKTDASGEKK